MLVCAVWDTHFKLAESKANISCVVAIWLPASGTQLTVTRSTSIQEEKSWRRAKRVTCISGPWYYPSVFASAQREDNPCGNDLVVGVQNRQRQAWSKASNDLRLLSMDLATTCAHSCGHSRQKVFLLILLFFNFQLRKKILSFTILDGHSSRKILEFSICC